MEARVKRGRLIRDSEIAIEVLELTAQSRKMTPDCRGIADVVVRAKVTVEGCFNDRRLCSTGFLAASANRAAMPSER